MLLLLAAAVLGAPVAAAKAEPVAIDPAEIAAVARRLAAREQGQYMLAGTCEAHSHSGWEGFGGTVKRCVYSGLDGKGRRSVPLPVILHVTSWDRIARWLISACRALGLKSATDRKGCIERLDTHINAQSNYQFPVTGLVDESFSSGVGCSNDVCYFTFRDGVAVRMPEFGVREYSTAEKKAVWKRIRRSFDLVREGDATALYGQNFNEPGNHARLAGTTREQLGKGQKENPTRLLDGINLTDREGFPLLIRKLHQAAQNEDANILISAWAFSHRSCLVDGRHC